jgi:hypothetical protein
MLVGEWYAQPVALVDKTDIYRGINILVYMVFS